LKKNVKIKSDKIASMVNNFECSSGTKMTKISDFFQETPKRPNVINNTCSNNLEENKSDGRSVLQHSGGLIEGLWISGVSGVEN
jgi:hypothetical protein